MYRTVSFEVKKNTELYDYLEELCANSKKLYNTTNFYIRQVMTGIQKDDVDRQPNEKEVLSIIKTYLPKVNKIKENRKSQTRYKMPTKEKWMLTYNLLDGIFKLSDNEDYRSLPAQVNQQIMKHCFSDWKSYLKSLKEYKKNPSKFLGKPKLPNYKEHDLSNAILTNIICKIKTTDKGNYLTFPKTKLTYNLGTYINSDAKLQQVEIKPYFNTIKVILIIKDIEYQEVNRTPERVLGIDLGINNFATISNNVGITPIIIKGKVMKERNQYFNKKKAKLCSKLQKGENSKYSIKESKHLNSISAKKDRFFRDCFYKIGHNILRYAVENDIDTIVVGKNKEWKQNLNIGKHNNQTFVSIPFTKFTFIFRLLCMKYGIQYIETEESYTSQSSFLDNDEIPVYKETDTNVSFSGKRVSRGMYKSADGTKLNADINGASNIIRKAVPTAFNKIADITYVTSANVWNFDKFYLKRKCIPLG